MAAVIAVFHPGLGQVEATPAQQIQQLHRFEDAILSPLFRRKPGQGNKQRFTPQLYNFSGVPISITVDSS